MTISAENVQYDIQAEGLKKSFGNFDALRGIDLRVKRGEFMTLFGPNGAGKTTLIKLLATLTSPTSGTLSVYGYDVRKDVNNIRSVIGVISHDPYLYDNLSAFENIKFFGTLYGLDDVDNRARSVIKQVGLEKRMNDLVRTFSRGMKQRLTVARAIVHEPKILLLDEPYTGLDQHGAQIFGEMLSDLKSQRRTILMTTHNIDEGLDLSDRIGILAKGKIVLDCSKTEIQRSGFKDLYISKVEQ
ncbi:MAG: ABC transporter ATP-binding protein [Candidatus Dadabacteria bacterium]|nr:MAG: ABC transporter ATP-binding protein [Candidatus Dadabacteria bacterium]TDI99294.1 MAG: ABC transporter ATP-binding protein [Candidatus Dadabacteria bacterium]